MPRFQPMNGKGPELVRYDEYIAYIESGEPQGCLSHLEWLAANPQHRGTTITDLVDAR